MCCTFDCFESATYFFDNHAFTQVQYLKFGEQILAKNGGLAIAEIDYIPFVEQTVYNPEVGQ